MEKLTKEQIALLRKPLPKEAISKHPTKPYDSIKAIYVTERLNEVFGIGAWRTKVEEVSESDHTAKSGNVRTMVVVKTTFEVPEYGIYFEQYGGNDNDDRGDAYKGAVTDAITKVGSYLEIGIEVFKGHGSGSKEVETQMPSGVEAFSSAGFPIKSNPVTKDLSPRELCILAANRVIAEPADLQAVETMIANVSTTDKLTPEDKDTLLPQLLTVKEEMEAGTWVNPKKKRKATL